MGALIGFDTDAECLSQIGQGMGFLFADVIHDLVEDGQARVYSISVRNGPSGIRCRMQWYSALAS